MYIYLITNSTTHKTYKEAFASLDCVLSFCEIENTFNLDSIQGKIKAYRACEEEGFIVELIELHK